jgi:hypothetical protein
MVIIVRTVAVIVWPRGIVVRARTTHADIDTAHVNANIGLRRV